MKPAGLKHSEYGGPNRGGFTLWELLAAFAVLSVATSVFVSMFISSLDISRSARCQQTAAYLAEEEMSALLSVKPQLKIDWGTAKPGELVPLLSMTDGTPGPWACSAPTAMPNTPASLNREKALYQGFSWRAFAARPEAETGAIEVTVVVQWKERGRDRGFALTSAVPRYRLEGAA